MPQHVRLRLELLIKCANNNLYYKHFSTKSKNYTNLQFLFSKNINEASNEIVSKFLIKPNKISIVKVEPYKIIDWHFDSSKFGRSSVVIFPLLPLNNYAPCETENFGKIPFMSCYVFNTLSLHRVVNNEHNRFSLQLFFNHTIKELYDLHLKNQLIEKSTS